MFSDKFDNHWKCIPYAMATLTSSDGFMILFHLLRRGYTDGDKTTCAISNKELADVMGTSISSVRRAIDALKQLNLISCSQNKGALCTFYVNWSEIQAIHKVRMVYPTNCSQFSIASTSTVIPKRVTA